MYKKWRTDNAILDVDGSKYGSSSPIYDYGACSFPQLLLGFTVDLEQETDDGQGAYIDDGKNPCLQDKSYMAYLVDTYQPPTWDYVVMNDQTQYPAIYKTRQKSLLALKDVYSNFLSASPTTRPVLLVTHGYVKSSEANSGTSSKVGDVPEFTSRVFYGYKLYARALSEILPEAQQPLLAPSGLAFLLIYEEDRDMWDKLFYYDGFHPSPHGTYLIGCVLYSTLFRRLPPASTSLQSDISKLWSRARKMQINSKKYPVLPIPTTQEAKYLRNVAKRIVLLGKIPDSLLNEEEVVALEAEEGNGEWNNVDDYYWSNTYSDVTDDYY